MHIYRETTMKTIISQNVVESGGAAEWHSTVQTEKSFIPQSCIQKNYSPENDSEIRHSQINRN